MTQIQNKDNGVKEGGINDGAYPGDVVVMMNRLPSVVIQLLFERLGQGEGDVR